jgi:HAD superfamily hydrolase (TIGR01509 family)
MTEKSVYSFAIFDFEGTLVSFEWDIPRAVREAKEVLKEAGIVVPENTQNYAELYNFVSMHFPDSIGLIDEIYDAYDVLALKNWKPHDDSRYVLEALSNSGVKVALVSNVGSEALHAALKKFGLEHFLCVVSRNDVRLLKPDTEGLRKAMNIMGAEGHETLFIGDSIADVMAAIKAGIDVAVLQGENSIDELKKAGSTYILEKLSDVISLFSSPQGV